MLQAMTLRSFFKWQQYFRQRDAQTEAQLEPAPMREKSPQEIMAILDLHSGRFSG